LNALTGQITGTPSATSVATTYTVTATDSESPTVSSSQTFSLTVNAVVPVFTVPPSAGGTAAGTVGTAFTTYTVMASGNSTFAATGLPPGLTINSATGAINGTPTLAGIYVVTLSGLNATGTATGTATLTITITGSHIVNFSARAMSGPGADALIVGFVINGNGKDLLVRGIGPDLASFGISNFLANPILTLYNSSGAEVATDTGWGINSSGVNDSALIAATAASVGAFPLPSGSADSALLFTANSGALTSGLLTSDDSTGIGLIEIYDAGGNMSASLVNVSARMEVTGGDGVLIAGFVIGGNAPKTVLIRGDGPALSAFGVPGVLADPQIAVFSGSTQLASNAGWGTGTSTAAQLSAVFAQVGAFPLVAGSADSALLLTLQPGAYTVEVTSVSSATGVALVEVYDTQQ
jgi:hypothetical protein